MVAPRARSPAPLGVDGDRRLPERNERLVDEAVDRALDVVDRTQLHQQILQRTDLGASRSGEPDAVEQLRPSASSRTAVAAASSGVSLPSRRSSPTGFPVTDGSPNTPRRSSRIWNALPSGMPNASERTRAGRRAGPRARHRGAAAARPCTSRDLYTRCVGLRTDRGCRWRRRRGRGTGRRTARCAARRRPAAPSGARPSNEHVGVDEREVTDEDRRAFAEPTRPRRAMPTLRVLVDERSVAPRAGRGGSRRRPSRRRARGRTRAPARAPHRRRDEASSGHRPRRRTPRSRTRAGTASASGRDEVAQGDERRLEVGVDHAPALDLRVEQRERRALRRARPRRRGRKGRDTARADSASSDPRRANRPRAG